MLINSVESISSAELRLVRADELLRPLKSRDLL